MSPLSRCSIAMPILVAAATFGYVSGAHALATTFALPALAALLLRTRIDVGVPAQVLVLMACGLVAMLWVALLSPLHGAGSEPLELPYLRLGAAALLFAALRTGQRSPFFGDAGTFGAGLLVFLACGSVRTGLVFPVALALYSTLAFAALHVRAIELGQRSADVLTAPRQRLAGILLLVLAVGFTASLALAIPRLYGAVYVWALEHVGERPMTGFHDGPIVLGALHGLLTSDEVVARVEGDAGEHLRGNVYVHYLRGRWLPDRGVDPRDVEARSAAGPEPRDLRASIRFAKQDLDRFFLPALPGSLQLSPTRARVDEMGVARTRKDEAPLLVRLMEGNRRAFPVSEPSVADLALPADIGGSLEALAAGWVARDTDPPARIAALRSRLERDYVYSLELPAELVDESDGRDPLLAFLNDVRAGHCEYFASAMTLLARATGVPARLVTGYRVAEWNPYGGYAIVRERHAHAWTEVYLAGPGWVAVDPSPLRGPSAAKADLTPRFAGMIDYARVMIDERGGEILLVVLIVGLAGAQVRRLLAGRAATRDDEPDAGRMVPPYLEALLASLAASGAVRGRSESLEAFAERAERADRAGAELLRRCAAHRYGDLGDVDVLRREVDRFVSPE